MASTIRIEFKGLSQLGANLRELGSDKVIGKIGGQMTGAAARIVKAADKQNIARTTNETGLVEKNVIIKKLGKRQAEGLTAAHIVTVKKVLYPTNNKQGKRTTRRSASHLEFGTVNMPAEPHLGPALSNNITRALEAMRSKGEKSIAIAAARLKKTT